MFGINGPEAIALVLLALVLIGPGRLPEYAEKLGDLVKTAKRYATGATEDLKEALGPEFAEVDWVKLDPRQYDPRAIVRQALLEDEGPRSQHVQRHEPVLARLTPSQAAPFDVEST